MKKEQGKVGKITRITPSLIYRKYGKGISVFLWTNSIEEMPYAAFEKLLDALKSVGVETGTSKILMDSVCIKLAFNNHEQALEFVWAIKEIHKDLTYGFVVAVLVSDGKEVISSSYSDKEWRGNEPIEIRKKNSTPPTDAEIAEEQAFADRVCREIG